MRCGFNLKYSLVAIMKFCIFWWNDSFYVNRTCGNSGCLNA